MDQETLYTATKWDILKLLEGQQLSPIEISKIAGSSLANVSQQLRLLEMAGLAAKNEQHLDGVSLVPLLKGRKQLSRDALYWHYPHYSNQGGFPGAAIRMGDWKLTTQYPQRVTQMRKKLHAWYREVDARFLQPKDGGEQPWRPR